MLPDAKYWEVRVGEYLIKQEDDYEQTHQVEQVFHYPLYKGLFTKAIKVKIMKNNKHKIIKNKKLTPYLLIIFYRL